MSKLGGLQRTGVSIVPIPSGHESLTYHSHQRAEEWVFPRLGKRMVKLQGKPVIYDLDAGKPIGPLDE